MAACSTQLVRQVAVDAGQMVTGVLAAGALSVAMIVLGIVGTQQAAAE